MDIFGVGAGEILLFFIILIVVAGPKRMIQWSYVLGQYVGKFRAMFEETMGAVRKEFEQAQIDLPKDLPKIPTHQRFNILKEADKVISDVKADVSNAVNVKPTPTASKVTPAPATDASTNGSNRSEATTLSSSSDQPGDEKPKYDAWTPN